MAKKSTEKKTTPKNTPAVQEDTSLVASNQDLAAQYAEEDVSSSDMLISRILLMQGQSKIVEEEKAKAGQIVGSLEADLLADMGKTLEIIPFHRYKSFRLFKEREGGGKPVFVMEKPYDKETIGWENQKLREVEIDGQKLMCFITWNYYVLLTNEIAALPRLLSFSSTNFKVGKKLTTFSVEAKKAGLPLPFKTYILGQEKSSNEKGNWFIYTVAKGRKTEKAELDHITGWVSMVKAGSVKVHEDDELDDESGGSVADRPPVEEGVAREGDEY